MVASSEGKESLYDNPDMSTATLRSFWKAHVDILATLPLQNASVLEKYASGLAQFRDEWQRARMLPGRENMSFRKLREIIEAEEEFDEEEDALDHEILQGFDFVNFEVKTLKDLVQLGIAFHKFSGLAFMDLVAELREVESVPVLVVVDQYNVWEARSAFFFREKPVFGKQLCVPNALQFISKNKVETTSWTLKNGFCVAATSFRHSEGRGVNYENSKSSIPLTITVPQYTATEYLSAVRRYLKAAGLEDDITVNELLAFRMHTASNPRLVRHQTIPYLFPLAAEKDSESEGQDGEAGWGSGRSGSGQDGYDDDDDEPQKD